MSLTKTSVGLAHMIASSLADQKIELSAVPNTYVDELTRMSTGVLEMQESIAPAGRLNVTMLSLADALEAGASATTDDVQYPHGSALVRAAENNGRILGATLDLTQNKVTPMIARVVEGINKVVTERLQGMDSPLTLVERKDDPMLSSHYLQENVARYAGYPTGMHLRNFGLGGAVWNLANTGHSSMDAEILEFVNRVGPEKITQVSNALFNGGAASSSEIYGLADQFSNSVVAYFIAIQGLTNVPEGLNCSLEEWNSYCSQIVSTAGAAIAYVMGRREHINSKGLLVLSSPNQGAETGTIEVNSARYADYLANGGTIEALYGSFYERGNFEPGYLMENQARLTKDWENSLGLWKTQLVGARLDAMIAATSAVLTAEINALPEEELVGTRESYHARLRERLTHAKARDFDNMWHFARKAVCRVVFPHTDAEVLLLGVEQQEKIYPGAPVRELALRAATELMGVWLAEQIVTTVVK